MTIDKRTGKQFPSELKLQARDALYALPEYRKPGEVQAAHTALVRQIEGAWGDSSNDWTLALDPFSIVQLGAFEELADERPLEWFQEAGRRIQEQLECSSEEFWRVLNGIFDAVIASTDADLLGDTATETTGEGA